MFKRLKAVSEIYDKSIAQALNYLSVSGYKLLLIVNFGKLKMDQINFIGETTNFRDQFKMYRENYSEGIKQQ